MSIGLEESYRRINKKRMGEYSSSKNDNMEQDVFSPSCGTLLAGRYKVRGVIGKGQSAILVKAEDMFHPQKRRVAIKILHASYSTLGPQEASCLAHIKKVDTMKVANTIDLLNVFAVGHHFCMVFELLRPRHLHEYFQANKIQSTRKVAFQVIQSLALLSSLNIIHADIKPENILFQDGGKDKVKVIDFGNALYHVHDEISLYFDEFDLQTIIYRAPEVMFGLPFGPQIDMWSLGCVLAELFLGEPLFLGKTKEEILEKMQSLLGPLPICPFQSGKFFPALKRFVDKNSSINPAHSDVVVNILKKLGATDYVFADFIARLLAYDPNTRLDALEAMRHPFLASECALGYFLPSRNMTNNVYHECGYSPVILTPSSYSHRPKIDERIKKLHYSGLDLLRVGTESPCDTEGPGDTEGNVAKVLPFYYEENVSLVTQEVASDVPSCGSLATEVNELSAVVSPGDGTEINTGIQGDDARQVGPSDLFGTPVKNETRKSMIFDSTQHHRRQRKIFSENESISETSSCSDFRSSHEMAKEDNSPRLANEDPKGNTHQNHMLFDKSPHTISVQNDLPSKNQKSRTKRKTRRIKRDNYSLVIGQRNIRKSKTSGNSQVSPNEGAETDNIWSARRSDILYNDTPTDTDVLLSDLNARRSVITVESAGDSSLPRDSHSSKRRKRKLDKDYMNLETFSRPHFGSNFKLLQGHGSLTLKDEEGKKSYNWKGDMLETSPRNASVQNNSLSPSESMKMQRGAILAKPAEFPGLGDTEDEHVSDSDEWEVLLL